VREVIALTGQFAAIDELLTGRENLRMFGQLFRLSRQEAGRRADDLLEQFDLADAGDRVAKTYSGGMRRRLDLASSLLTRPRMLFLDEPTTGLDPRSRNQIWEEADQLADRIAVIDHGGVIAEGTGDELKDSVGGQMIEARLANAADRPRAIEALTQLGCGTPEPSASDRELTLPAPQDGITTIEFAARALREANIPVSDLGLRRPTLDDVFLTLTGVPASEDGDQQTDEYPAGERETAGAPR
jgi:ABC-type multidrug transport system ATPase subunit